MTDGWSEWPREDLERQLRDELSRVALVGELELEPESDLYEMALSVVQRFVSGSGVRRFGQLSERCPASLVVLLVGDGIFEYNGGEYWPNIALDLVHQTDSSSLGRQFERSLDRLGLERFDRAQQSEGGLRFVMPILLHGKVPRYCAGDLWSLLVHGLSRGAESADELLSYWKKNPTVMYGVDKPVRRFISYGGELAEDLVQRMVDLMVVVGESRRRDALDDVAALAEEVGINGYLVEAFLRLGIETGPLRKGERVPKPRVVIDRYSGHGPSVLLPPIGQRPEGRWTIRGTQGAQIQRQRTSRQTRREVPLRRSPEWTIRLESGDLDRPFVFTGRADEPVYFFDSETDELVRDQYRLRGDEILVLADRKVDFLSADGETPLSRRLELPELDGEWSQYVLVLLDLQGQRHLIIRTQDPLLGETRDARVSVAAAGTRPRITTETMTDVVEVAGRLVFDTPPTISLDCLATERANWRLRLRSDDLDENRPLDELVWHDNQIELSQLLPAGQLCDVDLVVRGPLGSDLRKQFIVIPGLVFDQPPRLLSPEEEVITEVRVPGMRLNGDDNVTDVRFGPGTDSVALSVVDPVSGLQRDLLVSVSRLLWMVQSEAEAFRSYDGTVVRVALDEIESRAATGLSVQLRRPEMVRLCLEGEGEILRRSDFHQAIGPEGRWTFRLRDFYTTAAQSGLARLELRLDAGDLREKVVDLQAEYLASEVNVESLVEATVDYAVCEVTWSEERRFRNREVRLWSVHRPWEAPICERIDDESECRHLFELVAPAGPYLVEIGVGDDWNRPQRPTSSQAAVCLSPLGRPMDAAAHLRSLDADSPIAALELVVAGKSHTVNTEDLSLSEVIDPVCQTILAITDEEGVHALTGAVVPLVIEAGLREVEGFVRWVPDTSLPPDQLRRLVLIVLPELLTFAGVPEDGLMDRLWEASVLAGAALDRPTAEPSPSSDRWKSFTGWDPTTGEAPERVEAPKAPIPDFDLDRLQRLAAVVRPDQLKPLLWGGFQATAFELLASSLPSREKLRSWRQAHSAANDNRVRSDPAASALLHSLERELTAPPWCSFFQDLLCCGLHLTGGLETWAGATRALSEAGTISPALVDWAVLRSIAVRFEDNAAT